MGIKLELIGVGEAGTDVKVAVMSFSSGCEWITPEPVLIEEYQTRTIYRNSDGYPLVIYPNGDGTWCDDDGNTYDFANGEDVYDENGVDYYYHGEPAYVRYMPKNQ